MKCLDWKKISNGKDFQRLANDLFALEINHPAFLSSNPEVGADGGWDGRYTGTYMGMSGIWNFQSKWTKHDLNQAYKQLRVELKKELEKAKKNKVKYFLLATNANLKVGVDDHVGKLEKLNENQKYVEKLFIWPKANLENRITQYSWLRHYYFDDCQQPMFIPPYAFDPEQFLEGTPIGREKTLETVDEFIKDTHPDILIIHAGGGYGKTHFITLAAERYSSTESAIQVWFCQPQIRNVNEAINDELNHQKNHLIFLDDAERYLDDTTKLIAHTKAFSPGKVKLILSCRSSGKEIVKNLADTQRVDYRTFELPQLSEKDLVEILKKAANSKKIEHPERIVKTLNGNLFLIVNTGKLIKGREVDPGHIKNQIKDNLERESINALKGLTIDDRDVKRLLKELSVIVPFSKGQDNIVFEKLTAILGLEINKINEALEKLEDAKVLRTIGSSIRFNPDMNGDIYLSLELDKENGSELINQIFENWLSVHSKQIIANLAAASRHRETDTANKATKELIKKWINKTSETSDSLKSKRMELITPIAFLAPDEAINLIYAYIDSLNVKNIYGPSRDTFGPVIYQILHIPKYEDVISKLILYIAQKNLKGTYNNYTPASLIKQTASPIEVNISSAIKSLSELSNWTENKACTEIEASLAGKGVQEALAGSHEYSESYGNQLTIGRKTLVYKAPFKANINLLRDKAMEVLKNLIFHPNDPIKKLGIDIVGDIGHEATSTVDDFSMRILSDKTKAIEWLGELIGKTNSYEILSSIEDVLVRYWANNNIHSDLSDKVANILRSYPRSTEYIIFRYFVAQDIIITNFSNIEKGAPKDDRWSWLVHNHFRLRDFNQEDLDKIVKCLSEKYKNQNEIIRYLNDLGSEINGIDQWQYIPLIETWSKFNKQVFIEIVNDKELLNKIPERFYLGIYRVASAKDKKYIAEYAKEILSKLDNLNGQSVDNLLDLISKYSVPAEEFLPWLSKIIKKSNSYIKHLILHRSYFIFKDRSQTEKNKVIDILDLSLEGVVDSHVLDMFNFLLNQGTRWNLPSDGLDVIRKKLFAIIKDIPSIDYSTDELLEFVINKDLNKFIELVEYRLKKHSGMTDHLSDGHFDPIPFKGFHSAEGLIIDFNDFTQLMDKINFWRKENLLYSFDIDHLLRNCKNHDDEQGDYLSRYIGDKVKLGDAENLKIAADALFGVPFSNDTADLFLNFLLSAAKSGVMSEAKDVFAHQVLSGGYTYTTGEIPQSLVDKKETLTRMYNKCQPGSVKNYIDSLTRSISQDIQKHLDEG